MSDITPDNADRLLGALGEQLAARGERFELVVIGGSALLALGLVERTTRDVDIVALRSGDDLEGADPLPEPLRAARDLVARDFALAPRWLNPGPTKLLEFGLPQGFAERLERRDYGPALAVHFASRYDQIHFKLYAAVDAGGPGKHEADLRALSPTHAELVAAGRWSRAHDPSPAFAQDLRGALEFLGVTDVDL
ncbi:MAG TPA: DUF6036 family nucleotidyltransferase [Solirubrobacterales bacterium]|nr:DUF6036 family nucleotidyltransferase [Solirubrobacterales bacterium]